MSNLPFKCHTLEEHAKSLADYLPNGKVFQSKNIKGKNLRQLLLGLGVELMRMENKGKEIASEHDINQTVELITEWESAVGIPDECFGTTGSIEERRRNVLIKLASMIDNIDSFYALAREVGFPNILIERGSVIGVFPITFPLHFFSTPKEANFTIYVILPNRYDPCIFPIAFPVCFENEFRGVLECLFRRFVPANVRIIFEYNLDDR